RLELSHLAAPEPKSGVSTNSTTPALTLFYIQNTMFTILHPMKMNHKMAGVPGFEPGNAEIKTRCLTAWRYP
ncbi:hypothetical protein, partial [uncultured Shewanella sp.]|uniref:hypothetical protein n=1 Tax=uncultured Shewanella sp. TaxID=173975 RepID=UPI002636FD69